MTPSIVALIPARAGSKRVPGKNMRMLAGKPLLDWTIDAALQSGIFVDVCVVTDLYAMAHGDERVRFFARSPESATDDAPDISWVSEFFEHNKGGDAFAILRPTSPFRTAETIRLAWKVFLSTPCDSLRAVRYAKENPFKMWQPRDGGTTIDPMIEERDSKGTPWHSLPSQQTMGTLYVQTGGLEIAWTRVVSAHPPTISGERVIPFHLEGPEAFDINTEDDWKEAERLMTRQPLEYLG